MQEFTNGIVAGDVLIRPAIKSPNYIPGVSGWSVNADGSAEFTDLTVGGSVDSEIKIQFTDGSYERLYAGNYETSGGTQAPGAWFTLQPKTVVGQDWRPGVVGTQVSSVDPSVAAVAILSPWNANNSPDNQAQILVSNKGSDLSGAGSQCSAKADSTLIESLNAIASRAQIYLSGDTLLLRANAATIASLNAVPNRAQIDVADDYILLKPGASDAVFVDGRLSITPGGSGTLGTNTVNSTPLYNGTTIGTWTATPAFANNFTNKIIGGFPTCAYRVDAFGQVQLRGLVTGGALSVVGATVFTMPATKRPATNLTFPVTANGGTEVYGRVDVNSNGVVTWRGPTVVTGGVNWFALNGIQYLAEQ